MQSEKVVYLPERQAGRCPGEFAVLFRLREDAVVFKVLGSLGRAPTPEQIIEAMEAAIQRYRGCC